MVAVSFAYKEMKDGFLEVLNVESLHQKAHSNVGFFCICCPNIARLKVLIFRQCGRRLLLLLFLTGMCLYCSWHRELRVGNSSKLLFQYESQMQVSRPRVLFVSRKQTADHGMSSKALVEKSASAVLYVQNLFQGYVG